MRARLQVSPCRLQRLRACRWRPARVAVTVLLLRSVKHPTSPDCLQFTVFTFREVKECLLRWRPSQGELRQLLMSRKLPVVHQCTPMMLAQFLLCCGSLRSMWMIGLGPMAMGRWMLPVVPYLRQAVYRWWRRQSRRLISAIKTTGSAWGSADRWMGVAAAGAGEGCQ